MPVRSVVEVDFPSPALAKAALRAMEREPSRAQLDAEADGRVLRLTVTAPDLAAMRARVTSAFRDLKVITDAMKLKGDLDA